MKIIDYTKIFLKKNSTTVLTIVGSLGVVLTAYVSAKNTIKAVKKINDINFDKEISGEDTLTKKDIVKISLPIYLPTVCLGLSSIACIVGINVLSKQAQASLMSAYALLDNSYKEYKNAVHNVYGEESEELIKKEITNNIMTNTKNEKNKVYTFFDMYGLRTFESTLENVENAQKALNELLQNRGYASLNDLYKLLNIDSLDTDDGLGWSIKAGQVYGYDRVVFINEKRLTEDDEPFYSFDFYQEPTPDYIDLY